MTVHFMSPYDPVSKNLGFSYNTAMSLIPDGDWACLTDYDVMFLTPDAPFHIHRYVELNPDAALMTCYTNRLHPKSEMQLLKGVIIDRSDIRQHIEYAEGCKSRLYRTTVIPGNISGMLMVISKKQWQKTPFTEDLKCLGVDNALCTKIHETGGQILRLDGIYVWHTYRLINGIRDKNHLL
jgi:GT2 family glycosyltransferase